MENKRSFGGSPTHIAAIYNLLNAPTESDLWDIKDVYGKTPRAIIEERTRLNK